MEVQYHITAEHVTGWIDHHESLNKIWLVMRDKNRVVGLRFRSWAIGGKRCR